HVCTWQGTCMHVARQKSKPLTQIKRCDVVLKNGLHCCQIVARSRQMRVREGDHDGQYALGRTDIHKCLETLPGEMCGDRDGLSDRYAGHPRQEFPQCLWVAI